MPKVGAVIAFAALSSIALAPSPGAAFGFNLGPLHLGLPLPGPVFSSRHWHRPSSFDASRAKGLHDEASLSEVQPGENPNSSLLYPVVTAPGIINDIFWPTATSQWPFGYDTIFHAAFAKQRPDQTAQLCRQPNRLNAVVAHIQSEIHPAGEQMQQLQRLGGALNMASGYLTKTCPDEIPAQPVARLQLMEWQIEKVAEALDIVRQPLQDFQQSLNKSQLERFDRAPAGTTRAEPAGSVIPACAPAPAAADGSVEQISSAVEPSTAQQDAMANLKQALANAASQLDSSCQMTVPASPLARLEATEARLDATWRAAVTIQTALASFENGLSDEQRTRLDATDFAASQ
jgi:LTXXQ motif family protein